MMNKDDLLNDDFLKSFKDGKELNSFLQQLQKRATEKILESELDSHLDYGRNQPAQSTNRRNGYGTKTIKNSYGEAEIQVPRDREGSFDPQLIPKRKTMAAGIETIIISLYAKGMSNYDIEEQIKDLYDIQVSTSTISRITDTIKSDIIAWQNRPLEEQYLIVWMELSLKSVKILK